MPLHVKSISMSVAVLCFFAVSVVGGISGFSPLTCCKRALTGALIAYVITTFTFKMINGILMNAMIKSQMDKQEEEISGSGT